MSAPDEDEFYEVFEDDEGDNDQYGEECGRWDNGRLTHSCSKAGSEECDFECPYRNSLYRRDKKADDLRQVLADALSQIIPTLPKGDG